MLNVLLNHIHPSTFLGPELITVLYVWIKNIWRLSRWIGMEPCVLESQSMGSFLSGYELLNMGEFTDRLHQKYIQDSESGVTGHSKRIISRIDYEE